MSASQCLVHPWLRRKPLKKVAVPVNLHVSSELDLAKDNLRCFVERWSEHPNSPYLFDTSYHTISPCVSATNIPGMRQPSLSANSPSPCGSIASLPDACNSPPRSPHLQRAPSKANSPVLPPKSYLDRLSAFDRRASDSSCFVRNNSDFVGRINLAEEIKKLSDKLLKFNSFSTDSLNNNDKTETRDKAGKSDSYFFSSVSSKSTVYDQSEDSQLSRRKFRLTNHNGDVPLALPCWSRDSSSTLSSGSSHSAPQSPGNSPEPPDMAKDLMNMLDKFEGLGPKSLSQDHRKSLSMEWSDVQTLGQRTMRSLSNYIQSSRGSVVEKKKNRFAAP